MTLPESVLQSITLQAEKIYPEECCGLVLRSRDGRYRVVPVRNVQNEMNRLSAAEYPRNARQAYWMDPLTLLHTHKEMQKTGESLAVIYHSHPDSDAFFSKEDRRIALDDRGEPVYADASYLVISVLSGQPANWKLFSWDSRTRDWTERSAGVCPKTAVGGAEEKLK